jgi:hypothetical protein
MMLLLDFHTLVYQQPVMGAHDLYVFCFHKTTVSRAILINVIRHRQTLRSAVDSGR